MATAVIRLARAAGGLTLAVAMLGPSHAQTTICYGPDCTVENRDGTSETLTIDQVNERARAEALRRIREIDCAFADSAAQCLEAKLTLRRLFY